MTVPVSLVPQRAYFAWMHLFLVLFAVGSAFITASNQQSVSSVTTGDSLRMPSGGGVVKRGDIISESTTSSRTAFGTAPPLTQQQAHATELDMTQVEAAGEKVGNDLAGSEWPTYPSGRQSACLTRSHL